MQGEAERSQRRSTFHVRALEAAGRKLRAPFAAADGYALATALDDVVDYAEEVADALGLYAVEASMEQATELADVLVGASEAVARALRCLRTGAEPAVDCKESRATQAI